MSSLHPVFNIDRLRSYSPSDDFKANAPPDPVDFNPQDNTPVFRVEALLRRRKIRNKVSYLVKWLGYPDYDSTWEPRQKLIEDVPALVALFDSTAAPL